MSRTGFKSLRSRLLRRLLWLGLLCSSVAIAAQAWLVYEQERARFNDYVDEIGRMHLPLLAVGLWDIEVEALTQQVEQIAGRKHVGRVVLLSATGLNIASDGNTQLYPEDAVLPIYALKAPFDQLGELRIDGNSEQVTRATLIAIGQKIIEVTVFAVAVGLLIAFWLYRELDQPLRRLAQYLSDLSPESPTAPPALRPAGRSWYDEVDMVERGFETLHRSLLRYSEERDTAIMALEGERDLLDVRVAQRTDSLQRVADYQAIVSQALISCLHLNAAGYPAALQRSLELLHRHIKAEACGLAVHKAQGWYWQFTCGERWQAGTVLELPAPANGWGLLPDETGRSWVYLPAEAQENGQLFACNLTQQELPDEERQYLQVVVETLFSLIERWQAAQTLERAQEELERLSLSDPLTALANRRRFDQVKESESRRAQRHAQPLSVLMLDIDHFKAYNDRYGHGQGDDCLVRVASCLSDLFQRAGEVPARLGGEEFAVILPGYDQEAARRAAERVRQAIVDLELPHEASAAGLVSVSIGCASWLPEQGELDLNALLDEADQALYRAKARGRNRVESTL